MNCKCVWLCEKQKTYQKEIEGMDTGGKERRLLTKIRKLKTNMRYLMQLRQSPSMAVPLAEASPSP